MAKIWNVEWLNMNAQRAYPLAESASRTDVSGVFTLPDSFLLELYLPVHAGLAVDPSRFFLSRLTLFPAGCVVTVGYDDGTSAPPDVAAAVIDRAALIGDAVPFPLNGTGDFADVTGKIVIGRATALDSQPAGRFTFSPTAGRLETDCVRPIVRGLSSISIVSTNGESQPLYGDIELVGGQNCAFTLLNVNPTGARVRWDAAAGLGTSQNCGCAQVIGAPIYTINGVAPDVNGNLDLVGTACAVFTAGAAAVILENTCAQPCCGSTELDALRAELIHFGTEAASLQTFMASLSAQVLNLGLNSAGAAVGGCAPSS